MNADRKSIAAACLMESPPALAAGNTVIIKPSEETPLAGGQFGEVGRDAGLNGAAGLRRHPRFRLLSGQRYGYLQLT